MWLYIKKHALHRLTVITLLISLVLPIIPLAIWSFSRSWYFPQILPKIWSLKSWSYAISSKSGVLDSLGITIGIALSVTFFSLLIGIPAGRALGIYKFKGKQLVELLILAPAIVPSISVVMGIHIIFIYAGFSNNIFGVILVHLIPTLPYMVFIMSGIFSNYNTDYEFQARSLGASSFKILWYVTLPSIFPGIMIGALFVFLVSWSQYILTLLIGGGKVITLPLLLFSFATSGRNDITGAIGIIYIIPGIIVLLLTAKYLSGRSSISGFGQI